MYPGAPCVVLPSDANACEGERMPEPLADKVQVAEYLGVHPGTLDRWAIEGKGPDWIKVEQQRRYDWADVLAWVNQRKVVTAAQTGK